MALPSSSAGPVRISDDSVQVLELTAPGHFPSQARRPGASPRDCPEPFPCSRPGCPATHASLHGFCPRHTGGRPCARLRHWAADCATHGTLLAVALAVGTGAFAVSWSSPSVWFIASLVPGVLLNVFFWGEPAMGSGWRAVVLGLTLVALAVLLVRFAFQRAVKLLEDMERTASTLATTAERLVVRAAQEVDTSKLERLGPTTRKVAEVELEDDDVEPLATMVEESPRAAGRAASVFALYRTARRALPALEEVAQAVAGDTCKADVQLRPLEYLHERAAGWADAQERLRHERLAVLACRLVVRDFDGLRACCRRLLEQEERGALAIQELSNDFRSSGSSCRGYRRVRASCWLAGAAVEVEVHIAELLKIKQDAHPLYDVAFDVGFFSTPSPSASSKSEARPRLLAPARLNCAGLGGIRIAVLLLAGTNFFFNLLGMTGGIRWSRRDDFLALACSLPFMVLTIMAIDLIPPDAEPTGRAAEFYEKQLAFAGTFYREKATIVRMLIVALQAAGKAPLLLELLSREVLVKGGSVLAEVIPWCFVMALVAHVVLPPVLYSYYSRVASVFQVDALVARVDALLNMTYSVLALVAGLVMLMKMGLIADQAFPRTLNGWLSLSVPLYYALTLSRGRDRAVAGMTTGQGAVLQHMKKLPVLRTAIMMALMLAAATGSALLALWSTSHCHPCLCSGGALASCPRAPFLSEYRALDLRKYRIREIQAYAFRVLSVVGEVDLRDNGLQTLRANCFDGLGPLRRLSLGNQALHDLEPGAFAGLKSLEVLDLKRNRLDALEGGVFAGLPALRRLDLDGNQLSALEPGVFGDLIGLQALNLSGNVLESLQAETLAPLVSLQTLSLEHNPRLVDLGALDLQSLTKLQTVWTGDLPCPKLPPGATCVQSS